MFKRMVIELIFIRQNFFEDTQKETFSGKKYSAKKQILLQPFMSMESHQ